MQASDSSMPSARTPFNSLERQEKIALAAAQVQDPRAFFDEADNQLVLRSEADDGPGFRQTNFFG